MCGQLVVSEKFAIKGFKTALTMLVARERVKRTKLCFSDYDAASTL